MKPCVLLLSRIVVFCVVSMYSCTSGYTQHIQFTTSEASQVVVSNKEIKRLERFLTRVFPTASLRREARVSRKERGAFAKPVIRKAHYIIVTQGAKRFAVVGFTARWKEPISQLEIFRFDKDGPIQVWRSKPWSANYYGVRFEVLKVGGHRNLLLFEEGGIEEDQYGLAGIFSFTNTRTSAIVRDITPVQPYLVVRTSFPFRGLLGQGIHLLQREEAASLIAKEDTYTAANGDVLQPTIVWQFNRRRWTFEPLTLSMPQLSATNKQKE